MRTLTATALTTVPMVVTLMLGATPASAEPPRPGCGYGDTNHAHQAAPGRDDRGFRPGEGSGGEGSGDENNVHRGAPGRAGDGATTPADGPFGCKEDPRG